MKYVRKYGFIKDNIAISIIRMSNIVTFISLCMSYRNAWLSYIHIRQYTSHTRLCNETLSQPEGSVKGP